VVKHHDQVEIGGFEGIFLGVERKQVQRQIELTRFLIEFSDRDLGDVNDGDLPVSLRQPKRMSANPAGQVEGSAAIRKRIRYKLIERGQIERVWFLKRGEALLVFEVPMGTPFI